MLMNMELKMADKINFDGGIAESIETYIDSNKIVLKGDNEEFKRLVVNLRFRFMTDFNKDREVPITPDLINEYKELLEIWYIFEEGKISYEECIKRIAYFVDNNGVKNVG